jgi:hypothetical protein
VHRACVRIGERNLVFATVREGFAMAFEAFAPIAAIFS